MPLRAHAFQSVQSECERASLTVLRSSLASCAAASLGWRLFSDEAQVQGAVVGVLPRGAGLGMMALVGGVGSVAAAC